MAKKLKPKYEASKEYEWNPEAKIGLTGQEFMYLYNSIKEEVFDKGGTSLANKMLMHDSLQKAFERAVEENIIKEKLS